MTATHDTDFTELEDPALAIATRWAGSFLASFSSAQTRRAYRQDLRCWVDFCATHDLHAYTGIRRTHIELYMRAMEGAVPPPAAATIYRRIATLSLWYRWLEDEDILIGNPAARVRRPHRHTSPQPWLNRNELTNLLAAAEAEQGCGVCPGVPTGAQRTPRVRSVRCTDL